MPHVVLNGKVHTEDIFDKMKTLFIRNEGVILKTSNTYIDREKKSILIESLVIEDGIVVRVYPGSEVEKTDGVKRILAETAKQLLDTFSELKVGKTNISEFLK